MNADAQAPRRLLIVDDERVIVTVLQHAARRAACEIETRVCHTGNEVQALAESFLPHLILLDLKMPGADGFEVISRLNEQPATRGMKVVIMTGLETHDTVQRIKELPQVVAFLTKPLELGPVREIFASQLCEPPLPGA